MRVLFLSHSPHPAHIGFARSINAKIKILRLKRYVTLTKTYPFIGYLAPLISFFYSFLINVKRYNVLFVDGGTSLYTAVFLKMRSKKLRIIYLDDDMMFFNLSKDSELKKRILSIFFRQIDGTVSGSEQNKRYASRFVKVPIEVCSPYPKDVKKKMIERKNYGLYVGRLEPDKKLKRIVRFALQCPNIEIFLIVGKGLLKGYLSSDKVIYVGYKADVEDYYNKCKFLVHIPDYDSYCTTVLEAAICGCYPIMSEGVGASCLFDSIFIVNNPDNFKEINEKMKYILDNKKEADSLLNKAVKRIPTEKQSLDRFKEKFELLLKKIAE